MFEIDTDFRYLYVNHNYLFYYITEDRIIVAEMFNEREDFMFKLFKKRTQSIESERFWED